MEPVLNVPRLFVDEHHSAGGSPQAIAVHVKAHEHPAVCQYFHRIPVVAVQTTYGRQSFGCLQRMLIAAVLGLYAIVLNPESLVVVARSPVVGWNCYLT